MFMFNKLYRLFLPMIVLGTTEFVLAMEQVDIVNIDGITERDDAEPCFEENTAYKGDPLFRDGVPAQIGNIKTAKECQKECFDDDECNFWTWRTATQKWNPNTCFLKTGNGNIKRGGKKGNGKISGPKTCPGEHTPTTENPGIACTGPYEPGKPGCLWTDDEVAIVRQKVLAMMKRKNYVWKKKQRGLYTKEGFSRWYGDFDERRPMGSKLIRLAFHDCIQSEDSDGNKFGCDGCLNWKGVGHRLYKEKFITDKSKQKYTNPINKDAGNNGLEYTVKALELLYTNASWPTDAPCLSKSLKDSGKSRADLWQFAANVALEKEIERANFACDYDYAGQQTRVFEGREKCMFKLHKPITFQYGRADCVPTIHEITGPREGEKPYERIITGPWITHNTETAFNPWGTGDVVLQKLKETFGLTAEESISLHALHSVSPHSSQNDATGTFYSWIGSYLTNVFYRYLASLPMYAPSDNGFLNHDNGLLYGDENGNPMDGMRWRLHCQPWWNTTERPGGPCTFRNTEIGCAQGVAKNNILDRYKCFKGFDQSGQIVVDNSKPGCSNVFYDKNRTEHGGIRGSGDSCSYSILHFAMIWELNFVLNFTVDSENRPRGCNVLDMNYNDLWALPGHKQVIDCPKNMYAPEGKPVSQIVEDFALDHDGWAKTFLNAWHKMQANGYGDTLSDGPKSSWLGYSYLNDTDDVQFPLLFTDNDKVDPVCKEQTGYTFRQTCECSEKYGKRWNAPKCDDEGNTPCPPELMSPLS